MHIQFSTEVMPLNMCITPMYRQKPILEVLSIALST